MKLNRILSSALVFVMLFATLVAVFPVSAFAEEANNGVEINVNIDDEVLTSANAKLAVDDYLNYNFESAEEMLQYELSKGRLVSAKAGNYTVYVNYFTGLAYYKNDITGQILTSNPCDPAYQITTDNAKYTLLSQIELTFSEKASSSSETAYNSLKWIREGAILEVTPIEGKGINVKYTIGDVSEFFIAPGVLLASTFKEKLCQPVFDDIERKLTELCGEFNPANAPAPVYINGTQFQLTSYNVGDHGAIANSVNPEDYSIPAIKRVLEQLLAYVDNTLLVTSAEYKAFSEYYSAILPLFTESESYSYIAQHNVDFIAENIKKEVSAIAEGKHVYKLTNSENVDNLRAIDKALRLAHPEYTKEDADAHELECGYNPNTLPTPLINVSIRYVLDGEGRLTVEIPTAPDQLVFDHSNFSITSLTPLKYFGAGDMNNDGYIFYPDGSGTIVEFDDFYYGSESDKTNTSIFVDAPVYGNDYVYSEITGAHREQITMPVYGMVCDVNQGTQGNYTTVTNGFFTIIEDGASTATLCFESGGGTDKYAETYAVIRPYPSDKYDLSKSLSVSGLGFYYVVAETGFEGSYKFNINMLSDESLAASTGYTASKNYYPSDYAGMAACYRDYLTANGTLTPLAEFSEDLPLYIEALGSMDIIKRILTFPVTVSTSLTTFEDIETIYNELSNVTEAKAKFVKKAEEYRQKAADKIATDSVIDDDDQYLIDGYLSKAAHYDELASKIENIPNINFRLTGFANGGMYFTYPSKVKWESSVGGKRGFKNLLETVSEVNDKAGYNFGIFPDFDFLFINNTAAFDGVTNNSAARMVDNRYASKQSYDSIQQKYESLFALVISTDSLDKLYTKFDKKYSKFDIDNLSVSTLGSTLNSNFDEDNLINREAALGHVTDLLDRMANDNGYSLMTDVGNIYSVKYVDHILNASVDSSHFRYSSFTIPFYGMVLHGYVNYAGSPLNYSGSPDYDILRSIENGASLYYILCYENTNNLKEDELLSQYYGIDYANWQEKILEQYLTVNKAIGDLQKYTIVDHTILIAERIIDADETKANYERLVDEFVEKLIPTIEACIDKANAENPTNRNGYYLNLDRASIKAKVTEILSTFDDVAARDAIYASAQDDIDSILDRYAALYPEKAGAVEVLVDKDSVVYVSDYSYVTDSVATDKDNYKYTDFTCDNGTVVAVAYQYTDAEGKTDTVVFLLNYNNFSVEIVLDGYADPIVLNEYGCNRLNSNGTIVNIK